MILAEREARRAAETAGAAARLTLGIEIERLKLEIARLRRERFGPSSERSARIEQLELRLEDLEEAAAETAATADAAVTVATFARQKPARRPLPDHLPRHRVVHPGPAACPCCGGTALRKLGEDVTETLERIPARWRVIQHVRERFSCRACETISQDPAPFHSINRGRAGPELLAEVVFGKFGLHLPLHRQSERFAREGVPIEVSTLADWVGAVTTALAPLVGLIEAHVRKGCRIHLDDTPVPVLAKGRTRTGRLWTAVRDDRPFGGPDPPAASYFYSADRSGSHAETWLGSYTGIVQADAFSGFGRLYEPGRTAGGMIEAGCWAHARRKFFELADLQKAPIAIEAVARIDAIFAIEREINGRAPGDRQVVRQGRSRPLVASLEAWFRASRAKLSPKAKTAVAIDYMLKRWPAFIRFLDDGRVCLSNNAAERAIRPLAVGRRNWTFAGSDNGGRRAAAMYTLIETAKLNGIDPRAWLADVLSRLQDHPARHVADLLPWAWSPSMAAQKAA
ncbi:MAG: IS66 family transposase [Bradyrhizobium sp.]|uniref:IS66 family transposase n=1 Tax=Bradyrhizobium sp. TaxID=376 RepID=UPI001D528929|nr:IS66 family transposase [Bradyrhizobium sp.]MBV9559372.1 IS66 family transposase [Bradyrhizobium sp.]